MVMSQSVYGKLRVSPSSPSPFSHQGEKGSKRAISPRPLVGEGCRGEGFPYTL